MGYFYPNSYYGYETYPLTFISNDEGKVLLRIEAVADLYVRKNFPTRTFPRIMISTMLNPFAYQPSPYITYQKYYCYDVTGYMTGSETNNLSTSDFDSWSSH